VVIGWQPDPKWRVIARKRFCRRPGCADWGVAEMDRGYRQRDGSIRESWWAYCGAHLYGRRIIDGVVCVRGVSE
jgi:hypothetical protein